jgi:alanine racemase
MAEQSSGRLSVQQHTKSRVMTPLSIKSPGTTARLTVNLEALKTNYRTLCASAPGCVCAGVVKADAYGLGVRPVSRALWEAGCRTYFVALLSEAGILRALLPEAEIYVLNGLLAGAAADYVHLNLRPVLASIEEIDEWSHFCRENNTRHRAAVHVDTGINRLGLEYQQAMNMFQNTKAFQDFNLCMVMSHLACADEPDHSLNDQQVKRFEALRELVPDVAFSLANSAGIIAVPKAHFDLLRPGIALYGSNPIADGDTIIKPVITLQATILQMRNVAAGQSIGYGATFTCQQPSKIAVLGLGYADGFLRCLSGSNTQTRTHVYIEGHLAPVVGRVSMDMIGVDVTALPDSVATRGTMAEVIGENISLDGLALASKTLSYEILTRLGNRFERVYT